MQPSNPLDTLIQETRKARDHAGRALAEDRRGHQQASQQLDTLHHYKQEYGRRLQEAMSHGVDTITLDNYRRFILSLDDAIRSAGDALAQQQEKVSLSQQQWRERQQQLSSYDTLIGRRATHERQQEARRESRHNDEITNNAQARRRLRDSQQDSH